MYLTLASVVSLIGAFLGFSSIFYIFSGELSIASFLILGSVAFDILDGKVARYMKQATHFGKEVDSLVDILSFGISPALLISSVLIFPISLLSFLIVLGGIYRLARFNIEKISYFKGVPITLNGLIVPVFYLSGFLNFYTGIALLFVLFFLMISTIKFKKL